VREKTQLIMRATTKASRRSISPAAIHKQQTKQYRALNKCSADVFTNKVRRQNDTPVEPPAKNTSPDANDAAAKLLRACPRPAGYVVQLLLVALYMSTYDERLLPDVHVQQPSIVKTKYKRIKITQNHHSAPPTFELSSTNTTTNSVRHCQQQPAT
jgi:hypothetical protein